MMTNKPKEPLHSARRTIMTVFGTRPEIIKLAPIIRQLEFFPKRFRTLNISSGQHTTLLAPLVQLFGLRVDHDLQAMRPGQPLSQLFARILSVFDPILEGEKPDLVLVQGDTTTAVAAAVAAFHRQIPVAHVEAGLRTNDPLAPFPEEMNRRVITRIAKWHFAATKRNRKALIQEGINRESIFVTGNPVVDALEWIGTTATRTPPFVRLMEETQGYKRIALTTHRRESFGGTLEANLRVLREFIDRHPETILIFPVHPNPLVRETTEVVCAGHPRIRCIEPLNYPDFIGLLSESWLIVSDSGGVQEEAPSLGKPLLVLREQTERQEAVEIGAARLAGTPELLAEMLEEVYSGEMTNPDHRPENPFGNGDSGPRIVQLIRRLFRSKSTHTSRVV